MSRTFCQFGKKYRSPCVRASIDYTDPMIRKISREAKLTRLQALQGRDGAGKQIGISGSTLYRYRTGKSKISAKIARRIDSAYHLIFQDTRPTYKTIKKLRKSQRGKLQSIQKQGSKYFAIDKVVTDVTGWTTDAIDDFVNSYRGRDFLSYVLKIQTQEKNWITLSNATDTSYLPSGSDVEGPLETQKSVILIIWLRRKV